MLGNLSSFALCKLDQFCCSANTDMQLTLWLTYTPMLPNTPTISTLSQTRGYSQSENKVYASDMTTQSAVLLKYSPFIPNTMFYLCFRILKSHLGEIKILNGVKFKANLAGVLLHHTYRFHSRCLWLSLFLATAHLSGSSAENSEHCYGLWQFVWAGISKRNVHNCYSLAFKPDTLLTQSNSLSFCGSQKLKLWNSKTLFLNTYTWTLSLHPFFFSLALSSTSTSSLF